MQNRNGTTLYSASDLVGFLECEHSTTLALTNLVTPLQKAEDDESAVLIQDKGYAHEGAVLDAFKAHGLRVAEIADHGDPAALLRDTKAAMEKGCDIVFQGTLLAAPLYGRTDFLRRVERPSALGAWSYEVVDTKLARSAKAKFAVQLAFYSDLLAGLQGAQPQAMHLVLGDGSEVSFRVADYLHYFIQVRDRFLAFVGGHPNGTYPQHDLVLPDLPVARSVRRAMEGRRPSQPGRRDHAQPDRPPAGSGYEHVGGARRASSGHPRGENADGDFTQAAIAGSAATGAQANR